MVEICLIFGVFFIHAGWPVPEVNETHYLAKAKHYWNPDWCAHDFFLNSADAHQVFYWTCGWITRCLSLPAAAWLGRIVTWGFLAWAWRRLSVAVVPEFLYSVLSAALLVAGTSRLHMAGEWIIGGFEAKGPAYVFVLLALEAIARNRWRAVWPLLGAASAFHVVIGAWSVVAAAVAWLLAGSQRPPLRTMLAPLGLGLLLSLPGLLPALALSRGVPPWLAPRRAGSTFSSVCHITWCRKRFPRDSCAVSCCSGCCGWCCAGWHQKIGPNAVCARWLPRRSELPFWVSRSVPGRPTIAQARPESCASIGFARRTFWCRWAWRCW